MGPISAITLGAVTSGIPSTVVAIVRGDDLLASTRAVGRVVIGGEAAPTSQLVVGAAVHVGIAAFWGTVLWRLLPRRHTMGWGAAAGLAIAALDLGVIGRRLPSIRRLPLAPQVADHVAFGMIVAWGRRGSS